MESETHKSHWFDMCRKDMTSEEVRLETINYSSVRKIGIFIVAILEAFSVGLIIFGWSALVYVYQQEGVYSHLCDGNNQTVIANV